MESKYHSFTDKVGAGRWAIGQSRLFLWGCLVYCICDLYAVKDIIKYDGFFQQELMGYTFAVVHRPNQMMCDVDAFFR